MLVRTQVHTNSLPCPSDDKTRQAYPLGWKDPSDFSVRCFAKNSKLTTLEFPKILSQNLIGYHWLRVSGNSMHCGMPYSMNLTILSDVSKLKSMYIFIPQATGIQINHWPGEVRPGHITWAPDNINLIAPLSTCWCGHINGSTNKKQAFYYIL